MILPLQLTFRQMEPAPALEARIRELAARLDRFSAHIQSCRVVVEPRSHRSRKRALYDFHLDIALPDEEIAISHVHRSDRAHKDPYVALHDAFRAARRRLEDYERRRRLNVKTHVSQAQGRICELDATRDCGRIATEDGRLVYFHRNSVLGGSFQGLTTGTRVRFVEEPGDLGPQASTVHVIS
ncbi:MAG TPA: HPF/RaiA family ribosome-associated protein [Steroidobacteraceae bacterium]|nr:HPF/RaiA family ribosome-associated protein [Steroidobacteraceae bacterium]